MISTERSEGIEMKMFIFIYFEETLLKTILYLLCKMIKTIFYLLCNMIKT